MSSIRMKRVSEEIQKIVSERILRGLRDPLPGFVTVRSVEVTSDFTHAKVFFSVFGSDADKVGAQKILDENKGLLRREVGREIRTRNTPELHFIVDDSGDRAARVHQLLREAGVPSTGPEKSGPDKAAKKPNAKSADDDA